MRKKYNRFGNKTLSVKELQELLPKLEGERSPAVEVGKIAGLNTYAVDVLRCILGFTHDKAKPIPQEAKDKLIEIFESNPDKSIYKIYTENKDTLGISGGYQTYYAIIRKAGLECNRKRNYWSVFKDKKLLFLRDEKKLSFSKIQQQFPERTKNALEQRYAKLKKGAA